MLGYELYFFISGIIFHAVLVLLILLYVIIPLASYLACSFSFYNFYAKGIGKSFGWWAWKASFRDWMTYGGGNIRVKPRFGEWRGFGDYTLYKDNPVTEDCIVRDEEDEGYKEVDYDLPEAIDAGDDSEDREDRHVLDSKYRRQHLKAPKRKPRPNIPPLKGKSK